MKNRAIENRTKLLYWYRGESEPVQKKPKTKCFVGGKVHRSFFYLNHTEATWK